MGNSTNQQQSLQKGEGLRILQVSQDSPFRQKVQPFFDFIVDIIPLELSQKQHPKSNPSAINQPSPIKKPFISIIHQNLNKQLQVKIVSTKYRNVRSIMVTAISTNSNDLLGLIVRKQKFDETYETYFPVADISINSPAQIAGLKQGEYLLGCMEFSYSTLDKFIQGLYDRFFDKEVQDKCVHLAMYDLVRDKTNIRRVLLKRGWGGHGLLGCEFLEGQVNKFPLDLRQLRQDLFVRNQQMRKKQLAKQQLQHFGGVSKSLAQMLRQNNKKRHFRVIKNAISVPVPQLQRLRSASLAQCRQNNQQQSQQQVTEQLNNNQNAFIFHQSTKLQQLQRRTSLLEDIVEQIRQYINQIGWDENQQNLNANEKKKQPKSICQTIPD